MAEKILMIALSPTMDEGKIASWKMKEGDVVKNGSVICEVETDKAVMEYECVQEGTLLKIVREEGSSAKVGELIAVLGKPGEDIAEILKEAAAEPAAAPAAAKPDETPAAPKPAPSAPVPAAGASAQSRPPAVSSGTAAADRTGGPAVLGYGSYPRSSPLARRIAHERGLDIRAIPGSGPDGRVVRRDVEGYKADAAVLQAAGAAPTAASGPAPAPRPVLKDESIPVSGMRAAIAKRLAESFYTAPHYFLRASAAVDELLEARTKLNTEFGWKLSLNAYFMKFAAEAVKRHPRINSTWKETTIDIHGTVDVGLAVSLPDGLITPVVRDCGNKGVAEIDAELSVLIGKAKKGGLKPEEYSGATFTISNLGSFGIEEFTAIINPPGSAILALGEAKKETVVTDTDEIAINRIMRMTLSCDHRTIDGAVGAAFLRDLKNMIEMPLRALL